MAKVPSIQMNNGLQMPAFGLGTYQVNLTCQNAFYFPFLMHPKNTFAIVFFPLLIIFFHSVTRWRRRCSNKACDWRWLSAFWHGTLVWKWTGNRTSNKGENCRRRCQAWGYFCGDQIVEHWPWSRTCWGSLPYQLQQTWFGLYRFVFDALSIGLQTTHSIRIVAEECRRTAGFSVSIECRRKVDLLFTFSKIKK